MHWLGYVPIVYLLASIMPLVSWIIQYLDVNTCAELQIFYFIGFALFCLESLLSIWVFQVFIILALLTVVISILLTLLVVSCLTVDVIFAASIDVLPRQWQGCRDET